MQHSQNGKPSFLSDLTLTNEDYAKYSNTCSSNYLYTHEEMMKFQKRKDQERSSYMSKVLPANAIIQENILGFHIHKDHEEESKICVFHNGVDVYHFAVTTSGNSIDSGQPFLDCFATIEEAELKYGNKIKDQVDIYKKSLSPIGIQDNIGPTGPPGPGNPSF